MMLMQTVGKAFVGNDQSKQLFGMRGTMNSHRNGRCRDVVLSARVEAECPPDFSVGCRMPSMDPPAMAPRAGSVF